MLVVDRLVGAIRDDLGERLVEQVFQVGVFLADADAGAGAVDDRIGRQRAENPAAGSAVACESLTA